MSTAKYLEEFLFKKDIGFLNKYHFNQGLDFELLDSCPSKSSISQVECTVVQKLNQGTYRNQAVIDFGRLFCDTFFPQKKYQKSISL
jgi:hypothetical protein